MINIHIDDLALSQRGDIPLPFLISLDIDHQAQDIECIEILRHLPGSRIVCKARAKQGQYFVLKLFLHPGKAQRDLQLELDGYHALVAAEVHTPHLENYAILDSFCYVAYEFINNSVTFTSIFSNHLTLGRKLMAEQIIPMVGRLHTLGFQQTDMHLDNFLVDANHSVYMLDTGGIRRLPSFRRQAAMSRNLAQLLSYLGSGLTELIDQYISRYCEYSTFVPQSQALLKSCHYWINWRIKDYLRKGSRTCSLFINSSCWSNRVVVRRSACTQSVLSVLNAPDRAIEAGECIKSGNTATVCRIMVDDKTLILKRYNIRNFRHRFSRCWRPSRAWLSWQNALRLEKVGISSSLVVAVKEERWGPFRGTAFILMEDVGSSDLESLDKNEAPANAVAESLYCLFREMCFYRFSHGDYKSTNFILNHSDVFLIDLDSMRAHLSIVSL
ncbi:MAG: lipopolysaccharide kinase InaA family protein [gamma proteobacterium symbiont of Bathyaustriella thionipta]|nr:lipopolysaccharide kinase InaA family protein [gamma proteobacterium symbiont of Bathyaustriella thionipta]